jgi:hypothetical protein
MTEVYRPAETPSESRFRTRLTCNGTEDTFVNAIADRIEPGLPATPDDSMNIWNSDADVRLETLASVTVAPFSLNEKMATADGDGVPPIGEILTDPTFVSFEIMLVRNRSESLGGI